MTTTPPPSESMAQRPRRAATRRSVLIADKVADWTIRIGGIGIILAVFGIMLFLVEVVVPLFTGGAVQAIYERDHPPYAGTAVMNRVDDYKTVSVALTDTGEVHVFHVGTGQPIKAESFDLGGQSATAFARTPAGTDIAFGFADGTVRTGKLRVEARILPADRVPPNLTVLDARDRTDGEAVYSTIPGDQVRRISLALEMEPAQQMAEGQPIVAMDYRLGGTAERPTRSLVTVDGAGVARVTRSESRFNLMTGRSTATVTTSVLPGLPAGLQVKSVLITDTADQVYIAEQGGAIYRYNTSNFRAPILAEVADLFPDAERLTAMRFLIGEQSLVVGGSEGSVNVYFRLGRPDAGTADGSALVRAHVLEPHGAEVIAIEPSQRGKSFVTADAEGQIWMRHSTSEQVLLRLQPFRSESGLQAVVVAPRNDGILALGEQRYYAWDISVPHPETTLETIFGKVWYEGYPEPTYTWQSSSGTDSFEPKLSLVPLIFGTIKAAFYSLLFAVPVALCAAIYTSEFLHRRVRSVVKPVMEMMASLPSVVLGFIAALILAPLVETWIAAVVLAFVAVPLGLLTGAYLWQLVPAPTALRLGGLPKFLFMSLALGVSVLAAWHLGPLFERVFFGGDFKAWANGDFGSDVPFLTMLLLPLGYMAARALLDRLGLARMRESTAGMPRSRAGLLDCLAFVANLASGLALSFAAAHLLSGAGLGVRGGVVDTYVQRNTLVVGFAMGFAVIPIIYTIAEDALNAVPEHLRAASLACGATPWQTAVSVILPTALSGVFAAVMIGMGRAVGETMIVVMAAGNTPILDWNVFNGLRALSANIAVELPEAVKDDTLYRMLFLAALTLFVMTFVVNTAAEVVRQRFRKRAAQL